MSFLWWSNPDIAGNISGYIRKFCVFISTAMILTHLDQDRFKRSMSHQRFDIFIVPVYFRAWKSCTGCFRTFLAKIRLFLGHHTYRHIFYQNLRNGHYDWGFKSEDDRLRIDNLKPMTEKIHKIIQLTANFNNAAFSFKKINNSQSFSVVPDSK